RSACRIIIVVTEGSGYCTGTLVNNVRNNGVPYVISGFHCMDGYTPLWDLWRFDFRYQSSTCTNPATEPGFQSMLGCDNRAGRRENDFLLLELFQNIPASYQAYFAGWDRSTNVPARSTYFHHPLGDIKKISVDTQAAVIQNTPIQWNNTVTTPTQHHFRVRPDIGSFQVGSSGAGLFNHNKRFVGQLHGGFSTCDSTVAYFGRMALAWNGGGSPITRLRDWLDPDDTDSLRIAGIENPAAGSVITLTGTVRTESGMPIPGVRVWLEGMLADTATTGASGEFTFPLLDAGMDYTLGFLKDTHHSNGVSTQDVIRIQRQILSIENLNSAYKQFAADVNQSGNVSTLDVILLRRIILTIMDKFPDVRSWQFFPANHTFADPLHPFGELTPNRVPLGMLTGSISINITGVKSGDVNESADPSN
ncbi:MAG TPA: carboxypeptidase regulatory-like domain-containing protein, partial [Saprospiraceae bacterium]|nr:carboxypeptidase regulatory-like domain-containing protein [Saprospiraceae bacterium]